MTFPLVPVAENVPLMVWVVPEVKVTVLGAPMVKLLKVLEPEIMIAPAPAPATVKFP